MPTTPPDASPQKPAPQGGSLPAPARPPRATSYGYTGTERAGADECARYLDSKKDFLRYAEAVLKLRAMIASRDLDDYRRFCLRRQHERIHHAKYKDTHVLAA